MKSGNLLTLSTSPLSQPARSIRRTANLARLQRPIYGRKWRHSTVKERDTETGLYYYGARYLDGKTSRWLSGDPAVGEYVPEAPVDGEARKRNGSLPGQGGVFNYVNLHVYHYAGNNPVKYTDPDGRTDNSPDGNSEQDAQPEDIHINPPGRDPTKSPGEKWEWRGKPGSKPGDKEGSWHNPETGESLHPDLDHPEGIEPHWDYTPGKGKDKVRINPDTGRPLTDNQPQNKSPLVPILIFSIFFLFWWTCA